MEDVTRRAFLKAAGLTLAGMAAARTAFAQEQEKAKEESKKPPEEKEEKEGEKKAEPAQPKAEAKKEASKSDEEDWDAAWKQSGSEETRTCPQCGGTMYRQGRTWTCNNCGYSYVE